MVGPKITLLPSLGIFCSPQTKLAGTDEGQPVKYPKEDAVKLAPERFQPARLVAEIFTPVMFDVNVAAPLVITFAKTAFDRFAVSIPCGFNVALLKLLQPVCRPRPAKE